MEKKQNVPVKLKATKCFCCKRGKGEFKILEIPSHVTIHLSPFICYPVALGFRSVLMKICETFPDFLMRNNFPFTSQNGCVKNMDLLNYAISCVLLCLYNIMVCIKSLTQLQSSTPVVGILPL